MNFTLEDYLYSNTKKLYNNSPQIVKSIFGRAYRLIPDNLKFGKNYIKYLSFLEESQWWSKEKLEEYQWLQTKFSLTYAYYNVPYYKNLLDERDISIKSIQNFNDFEKIPFLTKKKIRENIHSLLNKNFKKSQFISVGTGGTTGLPLPIFYEKGVSRPIDTAFSIHGWKRVGYKIGDKIVVLRGDPIKNYEKNKNFPTNYDPIKNRLILSSYHMVESNLLNYIKYIDKFKPNYLHVYPSSLSILANYMKEKKLTLKNNLKGIMSSSETLYSWQKSLFKKIFKCNVYSWYGLNEFVARAGPCELSSAYHIFPQYSYVELIKPKQKDYRQTDDSVREIVGTSFCNFAMPLIRYRTMDYAIPQKNSCQCGRKFPLIKDIIGRKQDFFIDITGSFITFIYADVPLWDLKEKLKAYQYIQKKKGEVILNIAEKIKGEITESDTNKVMNSFKKIYDRFSIDINIVESINRTESGKFLYFKQEIENG